MNTSAIYYPNPHLHKTIKEFKHEGLCRIEVSYYADSVEAESCIFHDDFLTKANDDLRGILAVPYLQKGLFYRLGMMELLNAFGK